MLKKMLLSFSIFTLIGICIVTYTLLFDELKKYRESTQKETNLTSNEHDVSQEVKIEPKKEVTQQETNSVNNENDTSQEVEIKSKKETTNNEKLESQSSEYNQNEYQEDTGQPMEYINDEELANELAAMERGEPLIDQETSIPQDTASFTEDYILFWAKKFTTDKYEPSQHKYNIEAELIPKNTPSNSYTVRVTYVLMELGGSLNQYKILMHMQNINGELVFLSAAPYYD